MSVLVAGQRFAALAPFHASSLTGPEDPTIVRLASGGFVAAWKNQNAFYAQLFDRHGAPVGGNFALQSLASFARDGVSLAPLPSGGFVASWHSANMDGQRVEIRVFNASGIPLGPETALNSAFNGQPNIAALTGGGLVVAYTGDDGDNGSAGGIKAQRLDSNGAKVGGEIAVNTSTSGPQEYPLTTGLPGDGFVVTWIDFTVIRGQIFDSSGQKVGGQLDLAPAYIWAPNLATLTNGNFILTYTVNDDLKAKIFSPAGVLVVAEFDLATSTSGTQYMSSVAPLETGDFLVTWRDASLTTNYVEDGEIKGQLFSSGGAKIGTEFLVNTVTTDGQGEPVSTAFGSGDVATLWVDYSDGYPPKAEIRLFFSTQFGTEGDDGITGTTDRDFIFALGGDDIISSGSAADEVNGGDGDDFLAGGPGDDTLDGGAGNDLLRGEDGNDRLLGGDGDDNMRGGRGVDSFDGGAHDEVLNQISSYADRVSFFEQAATQGAVADLRTGVIANDGFGNSETMVNVESLGGDTAFADTFYGNDSRNALLGSRGDNLYGLGGDDLVYLAAAAATVDGGAGADILILQADAPWLLPDSNGDGLAEIAAAMTSGWVVNLAANQIQDGYGNFGTVQGFETVRGSALDDVLFGGSGNDMLEGGAGHDLIHGLGGDDVLSGGDGSDLLRGYAGVDLYDGGADDGYDADGNYGDLVSFFEPGPTQGVVADLRTGIISNDGYGNIETMTGIESLSAATAYSDTLYGNDSINGLVGNEGDFLYGLGGDDVIQLRAAAAVADGGGGTDLLRLTTFPGYRPDSNGDGRAELAPAMTSGYTVNLAAGTVRDGYGLTGIVAGIENIVGSGLGDDLRGDGGANAIDGGEGNDFLRLQDGGADTANGGGGNDVFLFGGSMTGADMVDGGSGTDQLVLQGDYWGANALTLGTGVVSVENFAILPGNDTRFGDPGTNFYDYSVTTRDVNVAAGVQLVVDANRLRVGEDFTFNGSAELDGSFFIYGGGGTDLLTGGALNDVFLFGAQGQWGASDVINGGSGGIDQLALRGNYTLTFGAGQLIGIENIGLLSAHDTRFGALGSSYSYDLTMNDANVAAGVQMIVDGAKLRVAEHFTFDGSAEMNGSFKVFGGLVDDTIVGSQGSDFIQGNGGLDTLTGGGGADIFRYLATSDSTTGAVDRILDFTPGTDKIDLTRIDADSFAPGDQAFHWIGSNAFGASGASSAGELRGYQNGGSWFVEGDVNGDGIADLVIELVPQGPTPLGAGDFLP